MPDGQTTSSVQIRLEASRSVLKPGGPFAAGTDGIRVNEVEELGSGKGGRLVEPRFVDPVTAVVAASVAVIASRLVDHWLKKDEEGVQIDLRTQPVTISTLQNVPNGFVVIVDRDGKARVEKGTYAKGADLAPLLERLLGA